jgi:hypothetical protein
MVLILTHRGSSLRGPFRVDRSFAILVALLAVLFMAACGSSTSSNSPSNSGSGGGTPSPSPTPSSIDVTTYHYDNLRTGQNLSETMLTPANVNQAKFGKLGELMVDGKVDGQPLYLSQVAMPGVGTKNVLYVATEHGSVFAFDADTVSGTSAKPLWQISTQLPGESPSDDRGCGQVTPEIGITSTPVIDRARGAIYVVAVSKNSSGNYFHRLHALDITSGKELFGGPTTIAPTFPGNGAGSANGTLIFDPAQYNERPGLLELNGTIFTTWGSHCDIGAYTSWMIAFSADTLKQSNVLNLVPNGNDGGTWMSGAAPAADAAGNIYFIIGNGTFDTTLNTSGFPSQGDCGNCYVKVSSTLPLTLLDYFTPSNTIAESNVDEDLGSGGPLLLPDVIDAAGKTRHLGGRVRQRRDNLCARSRQYGQVQLNAEQHLSADFGAVGRPRIRQTFLLQWNCLLRGGE